MKPTTDFDKVQLALNVLQTTMEPQGGGLQWQKEPPERVRTMLMSIANAQWLLGIAAEDIMASVGLTVPAGARR